MGSNFAEWSSFDGTETNTNIESSKLLQKHVSKLKNQLEIFKDEYYIESDKKIDSTIEELIQMDDILRRAQNNNTENELISNINKTVIEKLKKINTNLKHYLKIKIDYKAQEALKYKTIYKVKLENLSDKLTNIINLIALNIKEKDEISDKDKKIISELKNLEKHTNNLRNFHKLNLNTKEELKIYMIENIKNIKSSIYSIKKLLK